MFNRNIFKKKEDKEKTKEFICQSECDKIKEENERKELQRLQDKRREEKNQEIQRLQSKLAKYENVKPVSKTQSKKPTVEKKKEKK